MSELDDQIDGVKQATPPKAVIQAVLTVDNNLALSFEGLEFDLRAMMHKLNAEYEKWEAQRPMRERGLIVPVNGKIKHR